MKFGKLPDISNVVFTLPPDPLATKQALLLQVKSQDRSLDFYIGCTGWSMKEWVGKVYPAHAKTKDYLYHYSRQFNTIELNTTHYRTPSPEMIVKWYEGAAEDFRFCPKILQTVSHSRNLGSDNDQIDQFCIALRGLKEKLGCCFIQLPPYFGTDRLPVLTDFFERFPKDIPLAIELRHESWFKDEHSFETLNKKMEEHNLSTVITDVAGRRDVLHMRLTTDTAMIRFVGNGLHPTDYSRIDDWVTRINEWYQQGLSRVYFFTHEPDNLLAPDLAAYLWGKLKSFPHIRTRGPILGTDQPGDQMSLF